MFTFCWIITIPTIVCTINILSKRLKDYIRNRLKIISDSIDKNSKLIWLKKAIIKYNKSAKNFSFSVSTLVTLCSLGFAPHIIVILIKELQDLSSSFKFVILMSYVLIEFIYFVILIVWSILINSERVKDNNNLVYKGLRRLLEFINDRTHIKNVADKQHIEYMMPNELEIEYNPFRLTKFVLDVFYSFIKCFPDVCDHMMSMLELYEYFLNHHMKINFVIFIITLFILFYLY